jgi:hypothetical protein
MQVTTKGGLLYADGELVGLPRADWLAHGLGFAHAEQLVRELEQKSEQMTKAQLICCNDSVELALVGFSEEEARARKETLAQAEYARGGNGSTGAEYRERCYWHIHEVDIEIKGDRR